VEEEPEVVHIPGPDERVKLMTQGQWMKGCPEGGEQSFLFGLYSQLSEGQCTCPHSCGGAVTRKKCDFFAIYVSEYRLYLCLTVDSLGKSEFSTYIAQLRNIVHQTCQRCHSGFCFACGEPILAAKVKRPTAATDDNPLFHCSNLQGVILGIGLSMLENLFSEQTQEQTQDLLESKDKARSSKRRKTDPTPDLDDDDTVYYAGVQGGKKRGGTGYAGDQKEDVSSNMVLLIRKMLNTYRLLDK
jgi:hypothetical protein